MMPSGVLCMLCIFPDALSFCIFILQLGDDNRTNSVAHDVQSGPGHIQNSVYTGDKSDSFHGKMHLGKNHGYDNQGRCRNAYGADGGEQGDKQNGQLRGESKVNAIYLGDKNCCQVGIVLLDLELVDSDDDLILLKFEQRKRKTYRNNIV